MLIKTQIEKAIHEGLLFLYKNQREDGGFDCEASKSPSNFSSSLKHKTPFFTALILSALNHQDDTDLIGNKGVAFLLKNRSIGWSWNYWERNSEDFTRRPYPDDLDDTACALAAISTHRPSALTGSIYAAIAKQLIATEIKPSGPYKTWLVGEGADDDWLDVDIAVNANIGFMLSLLDVKLHGLQAFVDKEIKMGKLSSRYYCGGSAPILYFLSRWYEGPQYSRLKQKTLNELIKSLNSDNLLMTAMLVTAVCNLQIHSTETDRSIRKILSSQMSTGSWSAQALYYEPPIKGLNYYAGSKCLTTTFCIEALRRYLRTLSQKHNLNVQNSRQHLADIAVDQIEDLGETELLYEYQSIAHAVAEKDTDNQITGMTSLIGQSFHLRFSDSLSNLLNTASLNGWIAYSIYDDFIDGEGRSNLVGVANLAHRYMVSNFRNALPENKEYQQLVTTTLNKMDAANTWEVNNTHFDVTDGKVAINQPEYGDLSQLAERSSGHMLAALGVLADAGYNEDIVYMKSYFYHYLIARQLNDDAHDWWEDLSSGRVTAVVASLLAQWGDSDIILKRDHEALSKLYWDNEIIKIATKIKIHSKEARSALARMSHLADPSILLGWLQRLDSSAEQALQGRLDAQVFIKSFNK